MTRPGAVIAAVLVVAAVIGVIGGAVWLLGGDDGAAEHTGTDAGFGIDPIGGDPTLSAVAVMAGIYTWQPSVQDSPWDALHAQRDHLSGVMATAAATPPDPAPTPLPEWSAWARSGDTLSAVVRPDGEARVEGAAATVPVTIAQTVQHTSGDATPYTTYTAEVTLTDTVGVWTVSNYRLLRAVT